jgi:transposase
VKKISDNVIESMTIDREAVRGKSKDFGFFVLLTNNDLSAHEVLSIYSKKDIMKKVFDNLKDRLNFNRMEVHSDIAVNNKLFILFISLIYILYIKK